MALQVCQLLEAGAVRGDVEVKVGICTVCGVCVRMYNTVHYILKLCWTRLCSKYEYVLKNWFFYKQRY
jgi:hypothetical protein